MQSTRVSWARYRPKLVSLLLSISVLVGCTFASPLVRERPWERAGEEVRVLLMPPQIVLGEVTAGGLVEPNAAWTATAKKNLTDAIRENLYVRNGTLVSYKPPEGDMALEHEHNQLIKLHEVVGGAILQHKYRYGAPLATKEGKFDWTLGNGVQLLRDEYNADYALFVYVHDTYASSGRMLLSVALSLMFFFPVHAGSGQQGFATLVDLETGDILWFNRLVSMSGNLRSPEPAREVATKLLTDLPV